MPVLRILIAINQHALYYAIANRDYSFQIELRYLSLLIGIRELKLQCHRVWQYEGLQNLGSADLHLTLHGMHTMLINKAPYGSIGTAFQFCHPFNGQPDSIDLLIH